MRGIEMRKLGVVTAAAVLAGTLTLTPFGNADITGSAHDFSASGWSEGEICLPCHTPHNANTATMLAPLWNHALTQSTYELYTSDSLKIQPEQPGPASIICLSCHDGTVALDSYGGQTGNVYMTGNAMLGTNLKDDHPIGIEWDHQNEIRSCSNCHWGKYDLPFYDKKIECLTCHDAHNALDNGSMLRVPNAASELCLVCHGK